MPAHAAGYSSTDRYRQSLRRLVHRDRDPVPVRAVGGVHRAVPARAFSPARGEGDVIEHGVVTKRVVRWVFDELPPSGARRGEDPSEHACRRDLESLVREVVQNANDQAEFLPRVTFRFESFVTSRWKPTFARRSGRRSSLTSRASRAKGGAALRSFLLVLLEIEDRNTGRIALPRALQRHVLQPQSVEVCRRQLGAADQARGIARPWVVDEDRVEQDGRESREGPEHALTKPVGAVARARCRRPESRVAGNSARSGAVVSGPPSRGGAP